MLARSLWRRRSHSTYAHSTTSHSRLTGCTRESSRMHSKVSSDELRSYIKATRPVLEILKRARYLPDNPCTWMFLRRASTSLQLSNVKSLQATYTLTRNWTTICTSQQRPAFVYPVIEVKSICSALLSFPWLRDGQFVCYEHHVADGRAV
jgi:hypothetical protein